jgi:hypothetical protein
LRGYNVFFPTVFFLLAMPVVAGDWSDVAAAVAVAVAVTIAIAGEKTAVSSE